MSFVAEPFSIGMSSRGGGVSQAVSHLVQGMLQWLICLNPSNAEATLVQSTKTQHFLKNI